MMICIIEFYYAARLGASSIKYVYTNTSSTSKLRQWAFMQLWHDSCIGVLEGSQDGLGEWDTMIAETEGLAHELALIICRGQIPEDPFLNQEKYLSEPTSKT